MADVDVDAMIRNFTAHCDCAGFPIQMNLVIIKNTITMGRRYGLFICGKCGSRKKVKYVGGRRQFIIEDC